MPNLQQTPENEFMDILQNKWDSSNVRGYDVNDGSLPLADSIENVGAVYPSLIISFSNETSPNETTYSFLSDDGPGSNNDGTLIATARAQDDDNNEGVYENDGGNAARADTICFEIIAEVARISRDNPLGASSEFSHVGSQRGPDAEDDLEESPPVRLKQSQVSYSYVEQ